jgi:hypothetical protein
MSRWKVEDQERTLSSHKTELKNWMWWCIPVIPATQEAEMGKPEATKTKS